MKKIRNAILLAVAATFCTFSLMGCSEKKASADDEAKMRKGLQNYPKTIEEVPPQYQDMVRQHMNQGKPPSGPPKAPASK